MSDTPRGFGRSARENAAYSRHFYPQTDILRNKANLRSRAALDRFERRIVADAALVRRPMKALTYPEFKSIHRHLFESVYDWAGEERDYASGRGAAPFCLPEYIGPSMEKLFGELRAEAGLVGLQRARFAERAAYYANEINAVHPFIEGNGRTLREFLRDLATAAGHNARPVQAEEGDVVSRIRGRILHRRSRAVAPLHRRCPRSARPPPAGPAALSGHTHRGRQRNTVYEMRFAANTRD